MSLTVGSLCSGYGGLDLAAEEVFGARTVWHAELNPAAFRILAAHWPGVPNYCDIKFTHFGRVPAVDILTAGYPCQPFSHAGRRDGESDPRHLWPFVAQAVRRVRPRYVLLENVAGHRSLGFGRVLADLAALRYVGSWCSIRASDVGAPHRRERVFILARDADRMARPQDSALGRRPGPLDQPGTVERAVGSDRLPDADTEGARRAGIHDSPSGEAARRGRQRVISRSARRGDAAHADRGPLRLEPVAEPRSSGEAEPRQPVQWGIYEPGIRRWERILGRVAPHPQQRAPKGGQQLSPRFVEWLMGLPDGWVTDVPGLTRDEQLTALGNGVVRQQAGAATRWLLSVESLDGAA